MKRTGIVILALLRTPTHTESRKLSLLK